MGEPAPTASSGTLKLRAWGFLLAALGGFAIALGALLPWATQTLLPGSTVSAGSALTTVVPGIDHISGIVVLICGIVITVGIFAMRFQPSYSRQRTIGIILVACALLALGLCVWVALTVSDTLFGIGDEAAAIATQSGLPLSSVMEQFDKAAKVELDYGVYLPMIGAVFAIIGTWLSLKWAKRRAAETPSATEAPSGHAD